VRQFTYPLFLRSDKKSTSNWKEIETEGKSSEFKLAI
jgi:hypothetical protein